VAHDHKLTTARITTWWGSELAPEHQLHMKVNIAVLQHEEIREQTRAAREDIPTTVSDMVRMLAETHIFPQAKCMCDLPTTQLSLALRVISLPARRPAE